MGPADYLVDTSALARVRDAEVRDVLDPLIQSGRVGVSIVTELEMGFSARSTADYEVQRRALDQLLPVVLPVRAEQRAREVQAALIERGQHRAVAIPDLLVAATAEIEHLTVLHYDADFDLIGELTGQPMEWVVARGTVH